MIIREIIEDGINFIKNLDAIFNGAERIADKIKNGNGKPPPADSPEPGTE